MSESKSSSSIFSIGGLTIFFTVLGYFVYGKTFTGALGTFVYTYAIGLCAFSGLIPIVGPFIFYYLGKVWLEPRIFALTGIHSTWLTQFLFWSDFVIVSILMVILTIYLVIKIVE